MYHRSLLTGRETVNIDVLSHVLMLHIVKIMLLILVFKFILPSFVCQNDTCCTYSPSNTGERFVQRPLLLASEISSEKFF